MTQTKYHDLLEQEADDEALEFDLDSFPSILLYRIKSYIQDCRNIQP